MYPFQVIDTRSDKPVALSTGPEGASSVCSELNRNGFVESDEPEE